MITKQVEIYATISIDDLPKVDFSQVGETNETTIRRSLDLTQFILKWFNEPTFIEDATVIPIQTMNHTDALVLMSTPEWSEDIPEIDE